MNKKKKKKKKTSPSENKHTPIAISEAIDDSRMWRESQIYGLFSKQGSGVNRL